jgi:2-keto-4-pentenoate hydratase/2-oxohepta-3-ene-1,7-dioic acid hydratase in catechol pathway
MRFGRAFIGGDVRYGEVVGDQFLPLAGDLLSDEPSRAGDPLRLDSVSLLAPLTPTTVLLMVNAFLPEGERLPEGEVPWMTPKLTTRMVPPDGAITIPGWVDTDSWAESELAVVIGREVFGPTIDEARASIFGYTVFNDFTTGEIRPDMDFFRCKGIEGFASLGPWIETAVTDDDIASGLEITATVAGETIVKGSTKHFKFSVPEVIRFAAQHTRLFPGDVISLGTPGACPVSPGDVVDMTVSGIGTLRNTITR